MLLAFHFDMTQNNNGEGKLLTSLTLNKLKNTENKPNLKHFGQQIWLLLWFLLGLKSGEHAAELLLWIDQWVMYS